MGNVQRIFIIDVIKKNDLFKLILELYIYNALKLLLNMRSKIIIALAFLLSAEMLFAQKKNIEEVQCIPKFSKTNFVALLSDNSVWWAPEAENWEQIPSDGLPKDKKIKKIDVYIKPSIGDKGSRVVALLEDNTMWWYSDGKPWEQVLSKGLPANAVIRHLEPYIKYGMVGGETRFMALLEDNNIWWYAINEEWEQVPASGLPANYKVTGIGTYQKKAFAGTDTRYVITLSDNSVWWSDGKKWKEVEAKGLPEKTNIAFFTAYTKFGALNIDGRMIGIMNDGSMWWLASTSKNWQKLDTQGLPKDYKVKSVEMYQKNAGLAGDARVIILMEDNTIWWYAEKTGWTKINTKKLTS